jgi:hypothetical protein
MTIGQRERIVYRVVERAGREGSFLPPHGVGYGLSDDLGLVLNKTIKGPSKFRTMHKSVVGFVTEETKDHVTIQRADGQRVRIPTTDIIERTGLN